MLPANCGTADNNQAHVEVEGSAGGNTEANHKELDQQAQVDVVWVVPVLCMCV